MINGIPQYNAILCSGINAKLITTILFVIKAKIGTIGYNGVLYFKSSNFPPFYILTSKAQLRQGNNDPT